MFRAEPESSYAFTALLAIRGTNIRVLCYLQVDYLGRGDLYVVFSKDTGLPMITPSLAYEGEEGVWGLQERTTCPHQLPAEVIVTCI